MFVSDNAGAARQRYPRNNRCKDVGYHGCEQSSYARKPQPQKTRFLDKRPRSRGFYNGNSQDQVIKDKSFAVSLTITNLGRGWDVYQSNRNQM